MSDLMSKSEPTYFGDRPGESRDNYAVYLLKNLNDASGGVPAMIHDCELALGYTGQWQVDGGEQHRPRIYANLCAKVFMHLLLVYSLGSLSFFLWAAYREASCAS